MNKLFAEMAERLNAHDSKSCYAGMYTRVQIPFSAPKRRINNAKTLKIRLFSYSIKDYLFKIGEVRGISKRIITIYSAFYLLSEGTRPINHDT